jgi:hypothetical protein
MKTAQIRWRNLLNFVAAGSLVVAAGTLIPLHAQQAGRAATKANAQKSPETATRRSADEPDPRMVEFRMRAKARWRAQQITTRKAEAEYHHARLDREIAEITLLDYQDSVSPRDLALVEGEIAVAESDLSRAEDRVVWAKRMFNKGFVNQAQKNSEELALKRAVVAHDQAEARRLVLIKFTKGRTVKELEIEVEKRRSDELARKATWELEKSRESELERKAVQASSMGSQPASK